VALFALLTQFAVSFGHIHLDQAHPSAPAVTDIAKADPHGTPDEDRADHACAICIVNQMSGAAQPTAAPEVSVALISRDIEPTLTATRLAPDPLATAFRSRAPPLA
jgi:hypothetical protein